MTAATFGLVGAKLTSKNAKNGQISVKNVFDHKKDNRRFCSSLGIFSLNHAIFHIHIFLQHYFSEVIWGNPELSWNNPRVFLNYQEKTVWLPQENSKETEKCPEKTRSFQGIFMKFHEKIWKFPGIIIKFSVNNPKVFTENLKFPGKTQEFPGSPQVSWEKPEFLGKTGNG